MSDAIQIQDLTDIIRFRDDFPLLKSQVNDHPLIYFDNAATTQKPNCVLKSIEDYYKRYNSNIHRGAHHLANLATEEYEKARLIVKDFIQAKSIKEINFVKGTTEAINLVATAWGELNIEAGDEIIISAMEHHSNIVPWQNLCQKKNASLKIIDLKEDQTLNMEHFEQLLSERTKLVSVVYVSNSLGTINPVHKIIEKSHAAGAKVFIDAAQAAAHLRINVETLDCDFLAFSGHKVFAPTGIGVLYGKEELLNNMNPYQFGGEMIQSVSFEKTTYNELPYKFEAGTPNICGAISLGVALEYIKEKVTFARVQKQEESLTDYAYKKLKEIDGIKIYGPEDSRASVFSFNIENIHSFDLGLLLDGMGIAIRTGHHCCQPLMKSLDIEGTNRISLSFYNKVEEIDRLIEVINIAKSMLS